MSELTGQHEQKSLFRMPMKADLKSLVIVDKQTNKGMKGKEQQKRIFSSEDKN